jgi:hypothetical protein
VVYYVHFLPLFTKIYKSMRSLQFFLTTVGILCSISLISQDESMLAHKKYELGDYPAAITSYQNLLAQDPTNEDAMIKLAESYRMVSRLSEAAEWYGKVASMEKASKPFLFHYAKTLQELGKYREAKNWFLKYAEIDPVRGMHYAISCDYALAYDLRSSTDVSVSSIWDRACMYNWPTMRGEKLAFFTNDKELTNNGESGIWVEGPVKKWKKGMSTTPVFSEVQRSSEFGPIAFHPNGELVALTRSTLNPGQPVMAPKSGYGLFIGTVTEENQITDIKPFPYNVSGYATGYPAWSADDNALYFASNRPGGFGGYDIYVSYLEDGEWTYPQNMGEKINSPGDEISPFMNSMDLYFASDWHTGFGGFDLFVSRMNGFQFGTPENLGLEINTPQNEWSLEFDATGTFGFLASDRNLSGVSSIYHVQRLHESTLLLANEEKADEQLPNQQLAIPILMRSATSLMSQNPTAKFTSFPITAKKEMDPASTIEVTEWAVNTHEESERTEKAEVNSEIEDPGTESVDQNDYSYFIQVAALTKFKDNVDQFKPLARFGHVYRLDVNGVAKFRVGTFSSMGSAVEALKAIKQLGFYDSYVVREKMNTANLNLVITGNKGHVSAGNSNEGKVTQQKAPEIAKAGPVYKVRLTAYHSNTQFDTKSVSDLGEIEQWTKGAWRIIMLGGYSTLAQAKQALSQAKDRGYSDSYIVVEEDGLLLPYED